MSVSLTSKYITRNDIERLLYTMKESRYYQKHIAGYDNDKIRLIIDKLSKNISSTRNDKLVNYDRWIKAPSVLTYFSYSDEEISTMISVIKSLNRIDFSCSTYFKHFDGGYQGLIEMLENELLARQESWYRDGYSKWFKSAYIAGHMLDRTHQRVNAELKSELLNLGYSVYNPQDNKDINDKDSLQSETPASLAARIVKADSDAIYNSDLLVFAPKDYAIGTLIELGQVKGRKDLAKELLDVFNSDMSNDDICQFLHHIFSKIVEQTVLVYDDDIRRTGQSVDDVNVSPYYVNAYKLGVINDLTDNLGILNSQEEVLEVLKNEVE